MTDITYGALSRMRPRTPREKARDAALAQSVMSRSRDEWQPEYQREPGLESPMVSPEDLLLMGGPSALKAVGSALRNARLLGGKSGAIPIREFERNVANFKPREGERTLYHATDIPWEGSSPRPGTWFSTEPPRSGNPFGNTVRAYSVPEEMLSGAKLPRGKGFQDTLATGSEPVAIVDEGGGLTSYVVRDPSVLKRMEVKRTLRSSPVSGSPRAQIGALTPEEANRLVKEAGEKLYPNNGYIGYENTTPKEIGVLELLKDAVYGNSPEVSFPWIKNPPAQYGELSKKKLESSLDRMFKEHTLNHILGEQGIAHGVSLPSGQPMGLHDLPELISAKNYLVAAKAGGDNIYEVSNPYDTVNQLISELASGAPPKQKIKEIYTNSAWNSLPYEKMNSIWNEAREQGVKDTAKAQLEWLADKYPEYTRFVEKAKGGLVQMKEKSCL